MRTLLALACLLVTSSGPALAGSGPAALFVDPLGDAGPGGVAVPRAFDHVDLARVDAALHDGVWSVTLRVAALPATLPPDTIWGVEWNASGATWQASWAELVVPGSSVSGAFLCHGQDANGAPRCDAIGGARLADGFRLDVPVAALGDGRLRKIGAVTMLVPEATAWPTFVVAFTGADVLDTAGGADVDVELPAPATGASLAVSSKGATNVPDAGAVAALGALAVVALASRRLR